MRSEPIPSLTFNPPRRAVAGFEVVDLATLQGRTAGHEPGGLHRVDFHTITLITAGTGTRTVDFVTYPCRPGTLLWIRPGQVQAHGGLAGSSGTHLLFTAAFPPRFSGSERLVSDWYGPVCRQLGTGGPDYAAVSASADRLDAEYRRPDGTASEEILQLQLAALLLQIDRLPHPGRSGDPRAGGEVYARFRAELERSFRTVRRAEEYADRLGYTVKTLTRACLAATGQPVKQVIDGRVTLEAQRLLAHSDKPVAAIARGLGFTEPTNFGKFFTRRTNTTPGDFRLAHRPA